MGKPVVINLGPHGSIEGVSITSNATSDTLCHYFGGIRYALPPSKRWQRADPLPSEYRYGTEDSPSKCPAGTRVCPQPAAFAPVDLSAVGEDCFQLNVWVPVGEVPENGWPVFVFFHGGFLQFGSPNDFNMAGLLHETDLKAIIVVPAYRLNLFGFLYSAELEADSAPGENAGNYGFWDQRLALEWVRNNIQFFGGDGQNITVAGYSAGAYSAFYQLAYDLWQPFEKAAIKRIVMWSNGPGFQPKSPKDAQIQFNQVLSALGIPSFPSGPEKLALLRALPAQKLIEGLSSPHLTLHQFRPITDSAFVSPTLFDSLDSGEFAARLRQRNSRIILGEVSNEQAIYNLWRPPLEDSLDALRQRLGADYSPSIVDALIHSYFPDGNLPSNYANWDQDAFGRVYADMQIHVPQRGLIHSLVQGGASDLLYRYRIEFRAKAVDQVLPVEYGATHTTDQFLWFWGNRLSLEGWEKKVVRKALVEPLAKFVNGQEDVDWGTESYRHVRTLMRDGDVEIQLDTAWDSAIETWTVLQEAMRTQFRL